MKRILSTALGMVILSACFTIAEGEDVPRINCDAASFDFGTVDNSLTIEHTFTLDNKGKGDLVIGNIRSCCGATASVAASHIPPSSNTTLAVKLSLWNRTGAVSKSIYVASNDPHNPHYRISLTGVATTPISVTPSSLDFGLVPIGYRDCRAATLKNMANPDFALTNTIIEGEGLTVSSTKTNNGYDITVTLTAPQTPVTIHGKVILLTDDPRRGRLEIPVTAIVAGDITTVPNALQLTASPHSSEVVSRCLAIRSRSGRSFSIGKVVFPAPGVTTAVSAVGTNSYLLQISNIQPLLQLNGSNIVIAINHPEIQQLTIPIHIFEESAETAMPARHIP